METVGALSAVAIDRNEVFMQMQRVEKYPARCTFRPISMSFITPFNAHDRNSRYESSRCDEKPKKEKKTCFRIGFT